MTRPVTRVAILTPDPEDAAFAGRWREVLDRMVAALAAEDVAVDHRPWVDDPAGLESYDLVMPMVTWGYHRAYERWLAATDAWAARGVRIQNPASVLRWNADKRYLGRLFDQGAPVVPTVFVDAVADADLDDLARRLGAERLIVKPQVSASAYQTLRLRPGDPMVDAPRGPAMVQPYLEAVEGEGEMSLIFFDREFSHAIRKVAAPGDFRVQPEWGGRITAWDPDPDTLAAANAILAAVEEPLLYARVDLVRDGQDQPVLMELELIEPDLYLGFDPGKGRGFARAVRAAAEKR